MIDNAVDFDLLSENPFQSDKINSLTENNHALKRQIIFILIVISIIASIVLYYQTSENK